MKENFFNAKEQKLSNGLNIITIKRDTQITAINCGVSIGSLYEEENERGISHFIEHMLFKGTKNRSNEVLNNELEQIGGEYNAYTDYLCTVYSIVALKEEIEKSLELLADMLQNSEFPIEEIERERGVILAEIRTSRDDIEDFSFSQVNKEAFVEGPLKVDSMGEESIVKKLNKKQLKEFYKKYYSSNNTYITIVSPYEHNDIIEIVKKYFGCWERNRISKKEVKIEDNKPIKRISYKKDIEQSSVIYLFTFHGLTRYQELALKILNHKFGASNNSILFRKLREERGLTYDVYSEMDSTKLVKTLYIYTVVSEENIEETLCVIDECIEDIKSEKIIFDDSTVLLMKKVLKTAVAATLEDSVDIGDYVLHQSMDKENIYAFVDDISSLEKINSKDIYDVARLVLEKPTIHILLPEKGEDIGE